MEIKITIDVDSSRLQSLLQQCFGADESSPVSTPQATSSPPPTVSKPIPPDNSRFLCYADASEFTRSHGVKRKKDYEDFQKLYPQLPSNPNVTYSEWTNWKDFLSGPTASPPPADTVATPPTSTMPPPVSTPPQGAAPSAVDAPPQTPPAASPPVESTAAPAIPPEIRDQIMVPVDQLLMSNATDQMPQQMISQVRFRWYTGLVKVLTTEGFAKLSTQVFGERLAFTHLGDEHFAALYPEAMKVLGV